MASLSFEKFSSTSLSDLLKHFESYDEDTVLTEISKHSLRVFQDFYHNKNFELLDQTFKICEHLSIYRDFDQSKILCLLEELLSCIDSKNLNRYLPYLENESMKKILKTENESKCKSILLRICNALLKRLGRKEHKEIKGYIQKIIANCMGTISERSGVNFRGQFALKKSQSLPICDNLCARAQQVLIGIRDPYAHFKDPVKLERYIDNIEKLLDEFMNIESYENECLYFTPNEHIFEFQMKDSEFVVFFMGSLIVLAQTLMKPSTTQQESSINLSEHIKNKLNLVTMRAKDVLYHINPGLVGEIEQVLENELPWIAWKLNKCVRFEKEPFDEYPGEVKIELEEGEVAGEEVTISKNKPLFEEGEREQNINSFIERVIVDLDPEEQIEEEFRAKNEPVFNWRLLRLISFEKIQLFQDMRKPDIEKIALELNPHLKIQCEILESDKESESKKKPEIENPEQSEINSLENNAETPEIPCKRLPSLENSPKKQQCDSDN